MSLPPQDPQFRSGAAFGLFTALAIVLAGAPAGRARGTAGAGAEPSFSALRVDGRTTSGRIVRLSADRITLAPEDAKEEDLPLRAIV
jgi:hypothetical protein